jgi:hypothetical protein
MSRFLISVGGTGQHVALALTRLVYMGAVKGDVRLIAIDPDNESPLPKLLESPAGMAGDRHPLGTGQVHTPFDVSRFGDASFQQLFVDEHHPHERDLFEAMFEEDMANIPVHKGMFGTPCVGATVFAEGANGATFKTQLAPIANAQQVYICGSVVGGTGAGIMHKLVTEVRKYFQGPMFGVFMLPWFKVNAGAATVGAITDAIIERNASHGIKYFFSHTIPALTSSVLVGYPGNAQSPVMKPLNLGAGDMGEHPHYLHLVAAYGLTKLEEAHTANRNVKAYGVAHDESREDWLLADRWESAARDRTLRQVIRGHRVLLNLLRFLIAPTQKNALLDYYHSDLGRPFKSRSAWGDELHTSIESAEPKPKAQGVVVDQLLAEFEQIEREVRLCVEWAQQLYPESLLRLTQGDPVLDALQKGTANQWDAVRGLWKGKSMPPKPTGTLTGAEIARHHARAILGEALRG